MPTTDGLVTGGGIAGLVMALVYAGRLAMEWLRERRTAAPAAATAQVTDAATANAVLVETLRLLQSENGRLHTRVEYLETEDRKKDEKITELEGRLALIANELAALRGGRK